MNKKVLSTIVGCSIFFSGIGFLLGFSIGKENRNKCIGLEITPEQQSKMKDGDAKLRQLFSRENNK